MKEARTVGVESAVVMATLLPGAHPLSPAASASDALEGELEEPALQHSWWARNRRLGSSE